MTKPELEALGRILGGLRKELHAAIAVAITNRMQLLEDATSHAMATQLAAGIDEGRKAWEEIELQVRSRGEAAAMALEESACDISGQAHELMARVRQSLARLDAGLELVRHGRDGRDGHDGRDGINGQDAALVPAMPWDQARNYAAFDLVTHRGGLWQCRATIEEEPGAGVAWAPVAAGLDSVTTELDGRIVNFCVRASDGRESRTSFRVPFPVHVGKWVPDRTYECADEVTHNNSTWRSRADNTKGTEPGVGDAWLLVARQGKPGRGDRGPPGDPGPRGLGGDPGPKGDRGPVGLVGRWCGAWRPGQAYQGGDVVRHAHALWIALSHTAATPGTPGTEWDYLLGATQ